MDFQHAENVLRANRYFASFACTSRVGYQVPACLLIASVLRGLRATRGDGAWKLRIRYRQHTCTARHGRVNSVVNARKLYARCEGTWIYKVERFFDMGKQFIGTGKSKCFPDIVKKPLCIYWFRKLFAYIVNYIVKYWMNVLLTSLAPFADMVQLWSLHG